MNEKLNENHEQKPTKQNFGKKRFMKYLIFFIYKNPRLLKTDTEMCTHMKTLLKVKHF